MSASDSHLSAQDLQDILFDSLPMGMAVFDRDLVLIRANPAWAGFIARYTSTPAGEVVPGTHILDLAPGTEATTLSRYRRALAGEIVRAAAVPMESAGIVSYWDVVIIPLVRNGEIAGIMDVTADVTERRQAEEDLRRREDEVRKQRDLLEKTVEARTAELSLVNEELQREIDVRKRAETDLRAERNFIAAVLDTAGALVVVLDREGRIVRFNRACEQMTGYRQTEARGKHLWGFLLPPEEDGYVRQIFSHLVAKQFPSQAENHWVAKSGARRLISWSNTVIPGADGNVSYVIATGIDLTEHRQAEDALRASEEKYRVLVENADSIILRMDTAGNITFFNEFAQRFLGYGEDEIVGRNVIGTIVPPSDNAGRDLARMIADIGYRPDSYATNENENMRRNGERVWVAWTNRAVLDLEGRPAEILCVGIDVTDRKRAEETLAERTRGLASLLEVSRKVASTLELEPLLVVILDQLKTMVDYTGTTLFGLEGETLKPLAHRGPIPQDEVAGYTFPSGRFPGDRELVLGKRPVIIADVRGDTPLARAFREAAGGRMATAYAYIRSWIGVPLIVRDRVIGTLTLDHCQPNYYTRRHADLALAFANQAAVAIENARLYAETSRRADELQTLFAVQQAITGRLDLEAILQLVADEARRLTNSKRSAVFLLDGDALRISVMSGDDRPDMLDYRMPVDDSLTGFCLHTGQPVRVNKAQADPRANADIVRRAGVESFLSVPLISGTGPIGAITVVDRLEEEFGPEDERVLTMLASGAVAGLENARLYREEQERRHEAEQRRRVAEGLRDILGILNSNRPLHEILNYIVAQACRLLGTDTGALYRLQEGVLTIEAAQGLPQEYVAEMDIPYGVAVVGRAVEERRPIVIPDMTGLNLSDFQDSPIRQKHLAWLIAHYRGIVAVPLVGKDEVYGGVVLYYQDVRGFSGEELELAATFASQAALAVENARLRTQAEQAAVAAERSRLARDLHDAVTQTLFSASLIAEVLPKLWERNPEEGRRRLGELRQLTRGALAEMRTLLLELRPATLIEVGLDELLRQLAEATTGRGRIPVSLTVEGYCPLPPDVQIGLYRIAQEALNNVAKHSGATQADVSLRCQPTLVELRVCDNGRGFDPGLVSSDHLGLGIMRERAEVVKASLLVKSRAGHGTEIAVTWQGPSQEGRA